LSRARTFENRLEDAVNLEMYGPKGLPSLFLSVSNEGAQVSLFTRNTLTPSLCLSTNRAGEASLELSDAEGIRLIRRLTNQPKGNTKR
jgi:hypothetical protein